MSKPQAHVSDDKISTVKEFVDLINRYPIIAAVNMENLPAKQLQNMRSQLRGQIELRMTKRRIIKHAFEEAEKSKPGISKLNGHLKGMPALLFTSDNPFTLYKTLKKNQSKAPIKAGQTAPNDIVVPAGSTGFAPGPIIGELGSFGIKTGIEDGKVAIKADSVVAKEGAVISAGLAGVLTRLGIEPMKVGLNVTAAYENGEILTREILDIDEEAFMKDLVAAVVAARNVSFNAAIPTKDTITLLLSTAAADALALALETNVLTDKTAKLVLAKAACHAGSLASQLPDDALSDEAKAAKGLALSAPAAATHAAPVEKKEEKKEKKPEEAAAGLGSLFG